MHDLCELYEFIDAHIHTLCIKNIKFYYASSIFLAFVRFQSNSDFLLLPFLILLTIQQSQYVIYTYILSRALNFPKHNNFSQSRGRETRNVDVKARKAGSREDCGDATQFLRHNRLSYEI